MSSCRSRTSDNRRDFVSRVRRENEEEFGPAARTAVEQMLSAGHTHPWTYVYELTQNAIDAGARRVAWKRIGEDAVRFQHDGERALAEEHVRALSSLGRSTKGLATIGFMGVGFKSVFARFHQARVSGAGWRFRFDVATDRGDLGSRVTRWFDTLLPQWDEAPPLDPATGYTTVFQLGQPADPDLPLAADLDRLAVTPDPVPLAVLALRGLEEVRIDEATWRLSAEHDVVEVRSSPEEGAFRWQSFACAYRPGDDETRALLEARRQLRDQRDEHGERPERRVVALLPLDADGRPDPTTRGLAYATLPTQARLPFGFHLQADWLVDLDRQNLRSVEGNAWQEAIVRQVPKLVRQILVWLKTQPEQSRGRGYSTLADPTKDDGPLSEALGRLQGDFGAAISDLKVVPTHGANESDYCRLHEAARLPGQFRADFGRQPRWRPDLLFGRKLAQEQILGKRGVDFLRWLGWTREVSENDVRWATTVPAWWSALEDELSDDVRTEALFALWHGLDDQEWYDVPAVPTEAGRWLPAGNTRFLNEEPPSDKEPSGPVIGEALADFLPRPDERLPARLRNRVRQSTHAGVSWLKHLQQNVKLASVVGEACNAGDGADGFPLVELLEWALHRGDQRQDLVPFVMTEDGPRKPADALIADPVVDHGACRRQIFGTKSPLVEDYAIIEDRGAVVLFLERLGVPGQAKLKERRTRYASSQRLYVLREILAEPPKTSLHSGYQVVDYHFPFSVADVPVEALQDWLSGSPSSFGGFGRKRAEGRFHGLKLTRGSAPCTWIRDLRNHAWLLCADGDRHKPSDVLLSPDADYEGAPVAAIDPELANVLQQEGIEFGTTIPKSPAVRRLALRGDEEMPDAELAALLREVQEECQVGAATRAELDAALEGLKRKGVPMVTRSARRCGAGEGLRSDLGGWIIDLSSVSDELATVVDDLIASIPKTTTGRQALDFLVNLWEERPAGVEQLRSRVAAAYRYVLDDLDAGSIRISEWEESRKQAHVYGQGQWRAADASSLIVDDVQSPFIRQLLSDDRVAVAASHLGDTHEAVRRVAERLDLPLLSVEVSVQPGPALANEIPWKGRFEKLVQILASLEDRREIQEFTFHERLTLRVADTERTVRAYAEGDVLRLAGEPSSFAVEAADQLVNHFRLGQRGNAVAWLTGALFALDNPRSFRAHVRTLAGGLGVEADLEELESDDGPEAAPSDHDPEVEGPEDPEREPSEATKTKVASRRPAVNQVAVFADPGGDDESTCDVENRRSEKKAAGPKSDRKARRSVVNFETEQGRKAEEAPAGQPGYDVLSRDPKTGAVRRIEVKGVQGRFEGNQASVLLSARQVNDALKPVDGAEYWLYVVDSTETSDPRVFPIPWTRWRGRLRYGFFARTWSRHAEKPRGPDAKHEAN